MLKHLRRIALTLFPPVASSLIFLILFNNVLYGLLILVALILLNIGFLLILPRLVPLTEDRKLPLLSSAHTMAVVSAWLLIEILFPVLLPKDCGQILNLSKTSLESPEDTAFAEMVFDNKQPGQTTSEDSGADRDRPLSWHRPGGKYVYHGYDPNVDKKYMNVVYWNSQGYYDVERGVAKTPGTYRIVLIGDSFVEAIQVPLEATYHKLLEKSLNTPPAVAPGKQIEVIALGSSGAGQLKNHAVLLSEGLRYKPDMVGITLYSNDFCDDDPVLSDEMAFAAGIPGANLRRFARHGYYALAFALHRLDDKRREKDLCNPELLQWCGEDIPRVEAAWNRSLDRAQASRQVCEKLGIKFVLIYIGAELELKHALDPVATEARLKQLTGPRCCTSWDMGKSLRRVASYSADHKTPFISLLDPLVKAQKATAKEAFGDHYTMFGHQVAAKTLFCSLRLLVSPNVASMTLPECCSPELPEFVYDRTATSQP